MRSYIKFSNGASKLLEVKIVEKIMMKLVIVITFDNFRNKISEGHLEIIITNIYYL